MAEESPKNKQAHAERVRRKDKPTLSRSREDALDWLGYETANVAKEAHMRIKDATEFVTKYAIGRMSEGEFNRRQSAYWETWRDALRGVADSRGMTDEAIYQEMVRMREQAAGKFEEEGQGRAGGTGASR